MNKYFIHTLVIRKAIDPDALTSLIDNNFTEFTDIIREFYESWDDEAYRKYLNLFDLDENKTPKELSEGMKVKFNLLFDFLSHGPSVSPSVTILRARTRKVFRRWLDGRID